MSYKITKCGDMKSGIGIPNTLFETKDKAYNFGLSKWGSGSYNVNGGWTVVECD